jgi:formylmethanofuran dehydrogenase subunit E
MSIRCFECGAFPIAEDDSTVVSGHTLCDCCAEQYEEEEEEDA